MVSLLLLTACKKENGVVKPPVDPPIETNDLKLKLDSKKVLDFQKFSSSSSVSSLEESEIKKYFEDRVDLSIPKEIIVEKDSAILIKQYGITERYKSKWEKDDLYLQDSDESSWKLIGSKKNKTDFVLTMSFYSKKSITQSSKNFLIGQEYNLKSYDHLLSKNAENADFIWLKIDLLYNTTK
jgi:hypothetical protein